MKNPSEINKKIYDIVKEFNAFGISIRDSTKLIDELGLDSLTIIQFITLIEQCFEIEIDDSEIVLENFETLDDFNKFVYLKIQNKEQEYE